MAMQEFTGYEYLLLDVAGNFGLDKELFETRIEWTESNMDQLESLMNQADDPIMYIKSVRALRDAMNGIPTGHMVSFDACSSGLQIMGAMMNCEASADFCGLIDPNRRADAYTDGTKHMSMLLGSEVNIGRSEVKKAIMTHYYGSRMKPIELFGEGTPEYYAFYQMLNDKSPGANALMQILLSTWDRDATKHSWVLPDGFHAHCRVEYAIDAEIEVDQLNHSQFTHRFYENMSTNEFQAKVGQEVPNGLSNAANCVHSIDGMICREMQRRCNYNPKLLRSKLRIITDELKKRSQFVTCPKPDTFLSVRWVNELTEEKAVKLSTAELLQMLYLVDECLQYKPFPVITIHDAFRCHANNMNTVRYWYKEMLAELAESNTLNSILMEVSDGKVSVEIKDNIADKIRQSNYALS